jgi:hypothetical protein
MPATTTIRLQVTPEAAARVAELDRRPEFDAMLEYTKQHVPNLMGVEVTRYDDPEEPGEPRVVITAEMSASRGEEVIAWDQWVDWFVRAFPPEVCRYFGFRTRSRDSHVRPLLA